LKTYLGARFSLRDGDKPHEMVFWVYFLSSEEVILPSVPLYLSFVPG
jgi:hypothetical protein